MIVADANLLVYFYVRGEGTTEAEAVLTRDPVWLAPLLWRSEFRNAVTNLVRSGVIDLDGAIRVSETAERRMRGREYGVESSDVLRLARRSGCSAYDCEYVSLAQYVDAKLVTTDRQVLTAFPETAISPRDFTA